MGGKRADPGGDPREPRGSLEQVDARIAEEQDRLTQTGLETWPLSRVAALKKSVDENVKALVAKRKRLLRQAKARPE